MNRSPVQVRLLALKHLILSAVVCALVLSACSKDNFVGQRPDASAVSINVSEALKPDYLGRTVRVQGEVVEVCQTEGCWMVISDGKKLLRMTFDKGAFTVPMTLQGKVVVEGTLRETIIAADEASGFAQSVGYSQEQINNMHGDQRFAVLIATGVLFEPGT